jgi:hypothetical protein
LTVSQLSCSTCHGRPGEPLIAPPQLAAARAQRRIDWTQDRDTRIITKDVGSERWAITVNPNDGTVSGNVYRTDGGPPQFVWCWPQATDGD